MWYEGYLIGNVGSLGSQKAIGGVESKQIEPLRSRIEGLSA